MQTTPRAARSSTCSLDPHGTLHPDHRHVDVARKTRFLEQFEAMVDFDLIRVAHQRADVAGMPFQSRDDRFFRERHDPEAVQHQQGPLLGLGLVTEDAHAKLRDWKRLVADRRSISHRTRGDHLRAACPAASPGLCTDGIGSEHMNSLESVPTGTCRGGARGHQQLLATEFGHVARHLPGPAADERGNHRVRSMVRKDRPQSSRQSGSQGLEPEARTTTLSFKGTDHDRGPGVSATQEFHAANPLGQCVRIDQMDQVVLRGSWINGRQDSHPVQVGRSFGRVSRWRPPVFPMSSCSTLRRSEGE